MLTEGGAAPREQVAFAFRVVTIRKPTASEIDALEHALAEQMEIFSAAPEAATKLLNVGEAKANPELSPVSLAAATMVASALLNHDEAIMRR